MIKTQRFNNRKRISVLFLSIIFLLISSHTAFCDRKEKNKTPVPVKDFRQNYQIGIGDLLEIKTWKEPDFSMENVLVRLDGKITIPLLDDIMAAGKTPFELKQDIQLLLKHFVDTPNVTVLIREPGSQKFYITGEVQRVGEYAIRKNLTIVQAFAMAGGFTEWATKKEILLLRKNKTGETDVIKVDYKKILKGKGLKQNIEIQADDTIIVP